MIVQHVTDTTNTLQRRDLLPAKLAGSVTVMVAGLVLIVALIFHEDHQLGSWFRAAVGIAAFGLAVIGIAHRIEGRR